MGADQSAEGVNGRHPVSDQNLPNEKQSSDVNGRHDRSESKHEHNRNQAAEPKLGPTNRGDKAESHRQSRGDKSGSQQGGRFRSPRRNGHSRDRVDGDRVVQNDQSQSRHRDSSHSRKGEGGTPKPRKKDKIKSTGDGEFLSLSSEANKNKLTNNNNMDSKYLLPTNRHTGSLGYDITYNSDDEVSVHKEMTELVLERNGYGTSPDSSYNPITPLKMDVMHETERRLHFKIYDDKRKRFEVGLDTGRVDFPYFDKKAHHTHYDVEYKAKPFSISVMRKSTGSVIFSSRYGQFDFEDSRLQISTTIHSRYIYGLGEHRKRFLIDTQAQNHNFVFWARDQPPEEHHNLYGSHPFFLALEEDGHAYGVFLLNSCPMEIQIKSGNPSILSYTCGGGVLDFYIFTGPSPIEVVQQYQEVIGRPQLPPYWSLGFHICRWGYESIAELNSTIEANRRTNIPYEGQWTDIDMLEDKRAWTYKDPNLPMTVKNLHLNGQRYIPIVDPGVSIANRKDSAYTDGAKADIFITNYTGTRALVGKVWPGETVFPDFSHPGVFEYWLKQAQSLYKHIPFDGLWLDMNEPASFVSGCVENCRLTSRHPKDNPSFVPENLIGQFLCDKTVCPSARQYQGFHYELHNLYGHMQMMISDRVCRSLRGRRSLIISRSTCPGSGRYGGHWTGDNSSTFTDLRFSISAMLDFNLFGIPLVGADIGGFLGSCSEELMIRWMQVGAFYPFMRNHNSHADLCGGQSQDPASYSKRAQEMMADVVTVRYSLLPYLYTLLYENHTKGTPVVRPLFMLYPKDKRAFGIDEQFMWGSSLLFSPCLSQVEVTAYFPYDIWYDFFTGYRLTKVGTDIVLPSPLRHTNIHVRGGSILATQTPERNTNYSRHNPFGILAALDSNHSARGKLYWDDGDCLDPVENSRYNLITLSIEKNRLTTHVEVLGYTESRLRLKLVQLFGLFVQPDTVLVNGRAADFTFTESQRVLQIDKLDVSLTSPLSIEW